MDTKLSRRSLVGSAGAAVIAGGALGPSAAVAGPRSLQSLPSQFTFSTWGDYRFYQDGYERMQKVAPEYAAVPFRNQQATSPEAMSQRLLSGAVAQAWDSMPDVVELDGLDIQRLADANLLVDLTDRFAPFATDVAPGVVQFATYQDRVVVCPWRPNTMAVWYRHDVWSEAGVNGDDIQLWSDFIEAGMQVTQHGYADGTKRYMIAMNPDPTFDLALLTQQGGVLFDAATGAPADIEQDPKFRQAFETQVAMATAGISIQIESFTPPWYQALKEGIVSCVIQGNWMDQILKQHTAETASGDWRIMEFPAFEPGGGRHALAGAAVVGALNKPNLDQDLAWAFMQHSFYDLSITPSLYSKWFLEPCWLPAQNSPENEYHKPQEFYGGQNPGEIDQRIQRDAFVPVGSPYSSEVMQIINTALARAISGDEAVDAAITSAAARIREIGA